MAFLRLQWIPYKTNVKLLHYHFLCTTVMARKIMFVRLRFQFDGCTFLVVVLYVYFYIYTF